MLYRDREKQVSSIESRLSEKKCVLVEAVAVCEIEMFAEETINVLPCILDFVSHIVSYNTT